MSIHTKLEILGKLATTIDFVIEDSGLNTLLNGSIVIDEDFNTSFRSGRVSRQGNLIACVYVSDLDDADMFKMALKTGLDDASLLAPFIDQLCYGISAEFEEQSARFKALP